jgi:hypothetical protein
MTPASAPNCDDCGRPMIVAWDTSDPTSPVRAGWRCRYVHLLSREQREGRLRHKRIEELSGQLPTLDATAATCRHEHDRMKFADRAREARQHIETLKAECAAAGCENCRRESDD